VREIWRGGLPVQGEMGAQSAPGSVLRHFPVLAPSDSSVIRDVAADSGNVPPHYSKPLTVAAYAAHIVRRRGAPLDSMATRRSASQASPKMSSPCGPCATPRGTSTGSSALQRTSLTRTSDQRREVRGAHPRLENGGNRPLGRPTYLGLGGNALLGEGNHAGPSHLPQKHWVRCGNRCVFASGDPQCEITS